MRSNDDLIRASENRERRARSTHGGRLARVLGRPAPRDEPGASRGVLAQVFGTTQGVRAEAVRRTTEVSLSAREARYRAIVDGATVGVSQADPTGRFLDVNDRYCRIVGRSREALLGDLRLRDVTDPTTCPEPARLRPPAGRRHPFSVETRYLRPDGARVRAGLEVLLVREAEGKTRYVAGTWGHETFECRVTPCPENI